MRAVFKAGDRDIRVEMIEPEQTDSARKLPALLILHGAGGNSEFWMERLGPHAAEVGINLYAPHYFDRTGTVRADYAAISDGFHVPQWLQTVDSALRWVAARPAVDPVRIGIVGVSLGAFLALGLAAQLSASSNAAERERIRCLIEVSGGLAEPYLAQATHHFPPTLLLHGKDDTVVPASHANALDQQLSALGVSHETRVLPGEGHWFSGAAQIQLLMAAAGFLQQYLAPGANSNK